MANAVMNGDHEPLDNCEGAVGGVFTPNHPHLGDGVAFSFDRASLERFSPHPEPLHEYTSASEHRRKSVASVQTERHNSSAKQKAPVKRRRSELSDRERRRRSRAYMDSVSPNDYSLQKGEEAGMNGVRRGARNSQVSGIYDLESMRTSLSENHRQSCGGADDEEDQDERQRSRVVVVCASIAVGIFLTAILLVAITLRMSPAIDEMVRKENEDILREIQEASGGSSTTSVLNATVQPNDLTENPPSGKIN